MEHTSSPPGAPSAEELFLAAIERAPEDRAGFLEAACEKNTALRAEVELLVACHEGAGGFLEDSPSGGSLVVDDLDLSRLPERIGKFKVVRLLGAGGMGCVYLGESSDPRREVALKVIRPGLGTSELVRRFRHEVQAIAMLQHPGIAQLYEAGAESTPAGPLPYFAMEYVKGPTLTGYARERSLDWRDRMRLIAMVAESVHHAHQKGVIHRDLKPGNILVDASGQPKILDFGVARLMEQEEGGARTSAGQLVGTLSYMSPEQLSGDPRGVDARADIYALGVMLYELLAGAPPYDVASGSIADAVKMIGAGTPRRLGEVDRRLRGDPEVMVEKAMAKDPAARYQSALELAADIRRCLTDQPIMARRPSTAYQLRKFAKRNKVLVGLSGAVLFSLVGGLALAVWQSRQVEAEREHAVENLEISRVVNEFLEALFDSADPDNAKQADLKVRDVLAHSTVDAIRARFPNKPRLRTQFHGTIGRAYKSLSALAEAEPHLLEAATLAEMHYPENSRERFVAMRDLGHLYKLQDRFAEGEPRLREATRAAMAAFGRDSEETINCRNDLASLILRRGDAEEAARLFGESVDSCERTFPEGHPTMLVSLNNWSSAMKATGKAFDAIRIRQRLVDECIERMGLENTGTITAMNNLAKDMLDAGAPKDAEPLFRRALDLRMKIQGPEHRSTLNTRCNLGACLAALGDLEKARDELAEVVRIADKTIPAANIDAAKYDHEYGMVLARVREHDEAARRLRRSYDSLATVLGAKSKQALVVARDLAAMHTALGQSDEAAHWTERATP